MDKSSIHFIYWESLFFFHILRFHHYESRIINILTHRYCSFIFAQFSDDFFLCFDGSFCGESDENNGDSNLLSMFP